MGEVFTKAQEKFIEDFEGLVRGRYIISTASTISVLGDEDLKSKAMAAAGRDRYTPDGMYPVKEMVTMLKVAIEAGIKAERFGQQVIPALKRGHPDLFRSNEMAVALRKVEEVWERDCDYEGIKLKKQTVDSALFTRANSPFPCDHTKGIIEGLMKMYNLKGGVEEIKCQWKDDSDFCEYEATWKV